MTCRDERSTPVERKEPPPVRQRADGGGSAGSGGQRTTQEPRRKRTNEQRYAGWGDGLDRELCMHAETLLPSIFPVESHGGAATIPYIVVDRRASALLLCTFSHCGAHVWPDGEIVEERAGDGAPERPDTDRTQNALKTLTVRGGKGEPDRQSRDQ